MRPTRRHALAGLALVGAGAFWWKSSRADGAKRARQIYANPLSKPTGALNVYHLGHSLVGRDMPHMVAQLAGAGHSFDSQLGWGTSLKEHWEPGLPINGFAQENAHEHFRPAKEALSSGAYNAIVLTEMVEINDAIRYHDAAHYLAQWAELAFDANPQTRIYLYETWHHTDDDMGWMARVDSDLHGAWQSGVKYPALARTAAPIHLIPAGQAMARFVRRVQAVGGIDTITRLEDLFAMNKDGTVDTIHFNDLGAYLVALTHYAVLYHRTPVGLPYALTRADGAPADAPSAKVAQAMQETVWEVVTGHPETGIAA